MKLIKNKNGDFKIYVWNDFCTPTGILTSTEFFLPSQKSNYGTKSQPLYEIMRGMMKMLLKNNSEKVKILVKYFETLSIENKLKLFIIVLESDMIKLKIDKQNLIELLKNFLCIIDKNYNKNRIVTLEYNMNVFILAKAMEMNETERNMFVYEMLADIYKIVL